MTINVESINSRRVVQETFLISAKTSLINFWILAIIFLKIYFNILKGPQI